MGSICQDMLCVTSFQKSDSYFVSFNMKVLLGFGVYSQLIILPVLDPIESIRFDCLPNELTNTFINQMSSQRVLSMMSTEE